jgi:hypothetical protein
MQSNLTGPFQKFLALHFFILFLTGFNAAIGQSTWYQTSAFSDGEWLKYKVKWGFIGLGTVEVKKKKIETNGTVAYKVEMHARSAKLPFINVFFVNEGYLNPYQPTLQNFTLTSGKEATNITTYIYKPKSNMIEMKTVDKGRVVRYDSVRYKNAVYDALGIFMSMRCLSGSGFNISLQNIVEFKISQTHFNFSGRQGFLKIDAFPERKKALKFSGRADWVGSSWAGVSGPFHGWISDDSSAIPLKVQIKIFLGSITLELEEFSRDPENSINTNAVEQCHHHGTYQDSSNNISLTVN